jgi:hypothetical protein
VSPPMTSHRSLLKTSAIPCCEAWSCTLICLTSLLGGSLGIAVGMI